MFFQKEYLDEHYSYLVRELLPIIVENKTLENIDVAETFTIKVPALEEKIFFDIRTIFEGNFFSKGLTRNLIF